MRGKSHFDSLQIAHPGSKDFVFTSSVDLKMWSMARPYQHHLDTWHKNLGTGPENLCFNKFSGDSACAPKFENLSVNLHTLHNSSES